MDAHEIAYSNGIKFVYAIQVFFVKSREISLLSAGLFHVSVW